MKIANILQIIKIVSAVAEQACQFIAETDIPQNQQEEVAHNVEAAVDTLDRAKKLIAVPPTEKNS